MRTLLRAESLCIVVAFTLLIAAPAFAGIAGREKARTITYIYNTSYTASP